MKQAVLNWHQKNWMSNTQVSDPDRLPDPLSNQLKKKKKKGFHLKGYINA